jgi:hypothetical protein
MWSTFIPAALALGGCVSEADSGDVPGVNLPGDMQADGYYEPTPVECPGGAPRLVGGRPATWTVIHYAAGDNDLQEGILHDINEMELGHEGSPNVNIVVQLDRRDMPGVWRFEIQTDSLENDPNQQQIISRVVGASTEEPNSGDYRTLIEFGRWAAFCYPADNYVVIIGGHGRGWSMAAEQEADGTVAFDATREDRALERGDAMRFLAPDDTNGTEMYVDQLILALNRIRDITKRPGDSDRLNRLVAFGSDACLMGTVEVAYDMRRGARYFVGSEQKEPDRGWPYSTIVRELTHSPSRYAGAPATLMTEFVDAYRRSYGPNGASGMISTSFTLAAVDTDVAIRARATIQNIVSILLALAGTADRAALLGHLDAARRSGPVFGDTYIDIGQFLLDLRRRLVAANMMPDTGEWWDGDQRYRELRDMIDELTQSLWPRLVFAQAAGSDYTGLMGLSVYFPAQFCNSKLPLDAYAGSEFANATGWDDLVTLVQRQDIREAHGTGMVDLTMDGQPFADLTADCHIGNNDVFVVVRGDNARVNVDGRDVQPPILNVAMTPSAEGGLVVTRAQIDARAFDGFRGELRSLSQPVGDPSVLRGESYAGSMSLQFADTAAGTTHTVDASFTCSSFQMACP